MGGGIPPRPSEISNTDNVIDSRDIIERIEELETLRDDKENPDDFGDLEKDELEALLELQDEAQGYAPDWEYGATLIRESYWEDYVQEMLSDIGDLPRDIPWYIEIDWEKTANNVAMDYTTVTFDGVDYYIR